MPCIPFRHTPIMLLLCLLTGLLAISGHQAQAAEPPSEPILRLETGMHMAAINTIDVDRAEKILVTGSIDKTIRVWDLASGQLRQTLRLPIDSEKEGLVYAVTISPDGTTVVASGWTEDNSIYIFNLVSGTITKRLKGLEGRVRHLTFSSDGRFLAATLEKGKGLRVYRASDWSLASEDRDYEAGSFWAAFDQAGRLVTTSLDGYLRLYDSYFKTIAKVATPGGKKPYGVAFSPDGNRVAVGYQDSIKVDVFSGKNLTHLFAADTSGVNNGDLSIVAWSREGHLLAGGDYAKEAGLAILRWENGGQGAFRELDGHPRGTIQQLLSLSDGRTLFAAGDPSWGLLRADGQPERIVEGQVVPLWQMKDRFQLSGDGKIVRFGNNHSSTFSIIDKVLNQNSDASLTPPRTEDEELKVTGWDNTMVPQLNGNPLKINPSENSRSLAIAGDRQSFLLGTISRIRRFAKDATQLWQINPGVHVWGVSISPDGKLAVAAIGDGTIRWYRMQDGKELLALFPHKDGKRWVLWTPSGYYAASTGGDELLGWHVNHGRDTAPDFFPAAKFRSVYYRPDVTTKILDTFDEAEALRLADAEAGKKTQEADIKKLLPPVVSVQSPLDGATFSARELTLRYGLRFPSGEPVTGVKIMIDGRPLPTERDIKRNQEAKDGQSLTITLPEKDCEVSIIAENRFVASEPATIRLKWQGKAAKTEAFVIKPKLYILAIGVGHYDKKELSLKYPAKDAKDFATVFEGQKGKLYREVSVRMATDATKDEVLDGLDWLEKEATSNDITAVFMAGHGVNDRKGDYYFLPRNANQESLNRTGVPYSQIKDCVTKLPGKVLLFIDTCHAGNVMGSRRGEADINEVVNDLSAAENGVVVFASSTGNQYSLEDAKWNNGAFTKALVEGISGKADYNQDSTVSINEMNLYLANRVKELTGNQQTPTVTIPKTVPDFPISVR